MKWHGETLASKVWLVAGGTCLYSKSRQEEQESTAAAVGLRRAADDSSASQVKEAGISPRFQT